MKRGINARNATMIECVGPLCICEPVKKSKTMSMSGKIETTISRATLGFTPMSLPEPLPKR